MAVWGSSTIFFLSYLILPNSYYISERETMNFLLRSKDKTTGIRSPIFSTFVNFFIYFLSGGIYFLKKLLIINLAGFGQRWALHLVYTYEGRAFFQCTLK